MSKAQQFDLIYAQSGYFYIVLLDAPRPIPFGQEKPRMSHVVDGLIYSRTHLNPYDHPSPTYGAHQYLQPYGRTSHYPLPTHRQSYLVATPPRMGGPPPIPMFHLVFQPCTSLLATFLVSRHEGTQVCRIT
jgi:hypothetical protein